MSKSKWDRGWACPSGMTSPYWYPSYVPVGNRAARRKAQKDARKVKGGSDADRRVRAV